MENGLLSLTLCFGSCLIGYCNESGRALNHFLHKWTTFLALPLPRRGRNSLLTMANNLWGPMCRSWRWNARNIMLVILMFAGNKVGYLRSKSSSERFSRPTTRRMPSCRNTDRPLSGPLAIKPPSDRILISVENFWCCTKSIHRLFASCNSVTWIDVFRFFRFSTTLLAQYESKPNNRST